MKSGSSRSGKNRTWLWIILVLALIHGLIYIAVVPPWQHYDEPNHFEYVWLAAFLGKMPNGNDNDPQLSRSVMESMIANNFFGPGTKIEDFIQPNQPMRIFGQSQLEERPFYYFIASLPIRLIDRYDIIPQLYVSRLVSLMFYLVSIILSWAIVCELTSPGNQLRWMLPIALALMPTFTDVMTSVNNDSAAVAIFSMLLWMSLRLVKRGFSWVGFLGLVLVAVFSYFSKATAMIALALVPLALIFSVLRGRLRWVGWAFFVGIVVLGLALTLSWGDAAHWYRSSFQVEDSRVTSPQAMNGQHAIQIDTGSEVSPSWMVAFFQPTSGTYGEQAAGKTYTLGGWVWADRAIKARSPILGTNNQFYSKQIPLTIEPTYFAISMTVEENSSNRVWVNLDPRLPNMNQRTRIYYDGLVLAEGDHTQDGPPQFLDATGQQGEWGGEPFNNMLRNGSAEQGGLRIRLLADKFGARLMPDRIQPSFIGSFLLDWKGAGWAYKLTADRIFHTFWGTFGWGHVPILFIPFWLFLLLSILGLVGAIAWSIRRLREDRASFPWEIIALLLLAILGAWGAAAVRGSIYLALPRLYIPVARYGFVAVIPTMLILVGGWFEWMQQVSKRVHVPLKGFSIAYIVGWLALAFLGALTILKFYN
jgi:hypothetical protein